MKIEWVNLKGFRNFQDETINFANQTLVIGANDVGKTNLIYALRILFDRSLSDTDLDLSNADYNVYSKTNEIEITVKVSDVVEDCLISTFKGDIRDNHLIIQYRNQLNGEYSIHTGPDLESLELKNSRFYIKRLNMEYVNTNRDLTSYMKRERNFILEDSKLSLNEIENEEDNKNIEEMGKSLESVNSRIDNLHYVKGSLSHVNNELKYLAIHNEDKDLGFVTPSSDITKMLSNMELTYTTEDELLTIGGDGRNNQIFLATWVARQKNKKSLEKVTFFAIEEPEAHLHPHQQRKLSNYLLENFDEQIFITTHSPHIASEFRPDKIVRLYTHQKHTKVAKGGCSNKLKLDFDDFGYRLNVITSDVFFVNGVFLVEGPSEEIFYKALAKELDIDIDRLNISIIPVNGVGFKPYIKICLALNIPFVLRTDSDIFKKTKTINGDKEEFYYNAGISRIMGIYNDLFEESGLLKYWNDNSEHNEWDISLGKDHKPEEAIQLEDHIRYHINFDGLFLSENDLENDLINSELYDSLSVFYGTTNKNSILNKMQDAKAENMLSYLRDHFKELKDINDNSITSPLKSIKILAEKVARGDD